MTSLRLCMSTIVALSLSILCPFAVSKFVYAPGATLKLCYLYFATPTDLGYTYSFHSGRLEAQERLIAMYPDIRIESIYEDNVFDSPNRTRTLLEYVQYGCHVVMTNSMDCLTSNDENGTDFAPWAARTFRNVSFVVGGDSNNPLAWNEPNLVYVVFSLEGAFYAAGVAAAHEAVHCIGVISAFEDRIGINIDGFLMGVRHVKPTLPVHVVTTNTWWWPDGEVRIAELLMNRSCNVVMRDTDPRDVDLLVAERKTLLLESQFRYFSIAVYSDLQRFVGDSVLTSIIVNWANVIVELVTQVVEKGMLQHGGKPMFYGMSGGSVHYVPISPLASTETITAVKALGAAVDEGAIFCGKGKVRLRDGRDSGQCLNNTERRYFFTAYLDDPHVIYHPEFHFETDCPAGTTYSYSQEGNITLTCTPCPVNTYSVKSGSDECTPCGENETTLAPGSSRCTLVLSTTSSSSSASISTDVLIAISVCVPIGAVVLFGGTGTVIRNVVKKELARRLVRHAPKNAEEPFVAVIISLKHESRLWEKFPRAMPALLQLFHQTIKRSIKQSGSNVYMVKAIGTGGVLIVSESCEHAIGFVSVVSKELELANIWNDVLGVHPIFDGAALQHHHAPVAVCASQSSSRSISPTTSNPLDVMPCNHTPLSDGASDGSSAFVERSIVRFSVGIHYGHGQIQCNDTKSEYDYIGPAVDGAALLADQAAGYQILISRNALDAVMTSSLTPDMYEIFGRLPKNETNVRQMFQLNLPGLPRRRFHFSEEKGENTGAVDSVSATLQQQQHGLTRRRVTALVLSFFDHQNSDFFRRTSIDDLYTRWGGAVEEIYEAVQQSRGSMISFVSGRIAIVFNARQPASQAHIRAQQLSKAIQTIVQRVIPDVSMTGAIFQRDSVVGVRTMRTQQHQDVNPLKNKNNNNKNSVTTKIIEHDFVLSDVVDVAWALQRHCALYHADKCEIVTTTAAVSRNKNNKNVVATISIAEYHPHAEVEAVDIVAFRGGQTVLLYAVRCAEAPRQSGDVDDDRTFVDEEWMYDLKQVEDRSIYSKGNQLFAQLLLASGNKNKQQKNSSNSNNRGSASASDSNTTTSSCDDDDEVRNFTASADEADGLLTLTYGMSMLKFVQSFSSLDEYLASRSKAI